MPSSKTAKSRAPLVGVIMGSRSDWETMCHTVQTLTDLGVPHEARVVSAHRTPDLLFEYAEQAAGRGLRVIIAGAGGAAYLPGMCAAKTRLPVLGVPVQSKMLSGVDSLLSIVQMPAGVPVGTLAIGKAGATNAALLAAAILANQDPALARRLDAWRDAQTRKVLDDEPLVPEPMNIGILGAGQLGRMLALAGAPLGLRCVFLDPSADVCAAGHGHHLQADYADAAAQTAFSDAVDRITFEFENVPGAVLEALKDRRPCFPPPLALTTGQDRLQEKRLFDQLGIPVPRYLPVASREALELGVRSLGLPCVLKTRRLGYDGKGQALLRTPDDVVRAWDRLGGSPLILEAFVRFERELSCVAVRAADGELRFYPVVENQHREGILRRSVPQAADPLQAEAEAHTRRVMAHFDYVGVMAFEFFVAGGRLLANEIAPRVHNSGHWTIEGATTSQFENHLRAVAGLPLGDTGLRGPCALLNLIGTPPPAAALLALPGVHLHLYGKTPKPGRKVGHVTVTAADTATLESRLAAAQALIDRAG